MRKEQMYGMGMPGQKDLGAIGEGRRIQSSQGKKEENTNRKNSRQRYRAERREVFLAGKRGRGRYML